MTWRRLFELWSLVEADLHQQYGIDLADPSIRGRSWRWLRVRIIGLLSTECRLQRAVNPPKHDDTDEAARALWALVARARGRRRG